MLKEYLQDAGIIADGAMGTYFSQLTGRDSSFSELANLASPDVIAGIHAEYIAAGARLIRTNTFSANTRALNISRSEVRDLILSGYELAVRAGRGREVFVAADIGPIPDFGENETDLTGKAIYEEYKFIVDTFLTAGADIFVFETFSNVDYLAEITKYLKRRRPEAFILTQFATTPEGFTRRGISNQRIIKLVKSLGTVDAYGFNCGVGPTHLYQALTKLDFSGDTVAVFPNAGYPEVVNERTIYIQNPGYFAELMKRISDLGVKILGGCCGTTPEHIRKLTEALAKPPDRSTLVPRLELAVPSRPAAVQNNFSRRLRQRKFVVAVELDPPFDTDLSKIVRSARICKENGVDIITIADSPLGRARLDSVLLAAKIKREVGIDTMPHLCCRDRNLNALKSSLLAAYSEGIRNILAVTGDSVARADKNVIKNVFNLNSLKLMELIAEMNRDVFAGDPYNVGGALNFNVTNRELEVARMRRKAGAGAAFFLTQPLFEAAAIDYLATIEPERPFAILGGIMPLVSYRNAQFLNNEIPGINVPADYLARFAADLSRPEAEQRGIELAGELAGRIRPYVDGLYIITPFNRIDMVMKILKKVLN